MQRVAWYYERPEQVVLQKIAERRRLGRTGESQNKDHITELCAEGF